MKILKPTLITIILLSFILIGSPLKYNCLELNLLVIGIGTILGIYKIIKKEITIKKIDIAILIFYITPVIPLLFNTYSSLQETLITLVRNISLFNIYYIAKEILKEKDVNAEKILNAITISGVILVILGIDELTSKVLLKYTELINIPNVANIEDRMFATFGYANSFAIVMAIEILICFRKIEIKKELYSGLMFLFLSALLLSYSRTVLAMLIVILIIYALYTKKEKIYSFYALAINLTIAIIYVKLFEKFSINKQYLIIWIITTVFFVLAIILAKIISKNYERIKKIKASTYIKIIVSFIVLVCILYIVGKQLEAPLYLFENQGNSTYVRRTIRNVDKNKQYNFSFEIEAISRWNSADNYSISIVEENKYYDEIAEHEITFNNYKGKKEINFTTTNETEEMVIYFKSKEKVAQKGLTIKSLYINDKKWPINYAYLPMMLVEKIECFNIKDKSVWERCVFFKDAIQIIKNNILLGTGGRGWLYNYQGVQSYSYSSIEVHSYFFQIFIENGVVAPTIWFGVVIYALYKIVKRKSKINEIDLAFILLTAHSLVDFDLSFYCMLMLWILLFVMVIKDEKKQQIEKLKKMILSGIIAINILVIVLGGITLKLNKENEKILENIDTAINREEYNQAIELIKEYQENEKYTKLYSTLLKIEYKNIKQENLGYIYENITKETIKVNTDYNMYRYDVILKIIEQTEEEEITAKLANIVIRENEEMIFNIKNKEKNRLTDQEIENYLERQERVYNEALRKLE